MRLDVYLTENGYADSRERAKRLILAGSVRVNGVVMKKPAFEIERGEISVEEERFVGRGGEKLEGALKAFSLDPAGMRAIDIGASTGGFTHCLLLHGAAHVTALDAGCGQLHPTLAGDARVTNLEKYNARELAREDVGEFDLARSVVDAADWGVVGGGVGTDGDGGHDGASGDVLHGAAGSRTRPTFLRWVAE